jgi:hypothetical protein
LDVGGDELVELGGGDFDPGGFVPEGFGMEVAAVVGVAVSPVSVVEMHFAEAGDGAHVGPRGKVGRAGEDHAVVEEDGFDWGCELLAQDVFRLHRRSSETQQGKLS